MTMHNELPFLLLENLHYHPPRQHYGCDCPALFQGLSLALAQHQRVGLVGSSGCGKTTLLQILLALQAPQSGTLRCEGREIKVRPRRDLQRYWRRVQYIPQDPLNALAPRLSVEQLLAEPLLRLTGIKASQQHLSQTLDQVELSLRVLEKRPAELSGGQAQRVALARALIVEPDFLLADEPVSGLDLPLREAMTALLIRISDSRKMGMLVVSHDITLAADLCQRLLVMQQGKIIEDRPVQQVLNQPHQAYTRRLLQAVPQLNI